MGEKIQTLTNDINNMKVNTYCANFNEENEKSLISLEKYDVNLDELIRERGNIKMDDFFPLFKCIITGEQT